MFALSERTKDRSRAALASPRLEAKRQPLWQGLLLGRGPLFQRPHQDGLGERLERNEQTALFLEQTEFAAELELARRANQRHFAEVSSEVCGKGGASTVFVELEELSFVTGRDRKGGWQLGRPSIGSIRQPDELAFFVEGEHEEEAVLELDAEVSRVHTRRAHEHEQCEDGSAPSHADQLATGTLFPASSTVT